METIILAAGLMLVFTAMTLLVLVVALSVRKPEKGGRMAATVRLGEVAKKLMPQAIVSRYERMLLLAGSPRDMSVETVIGLKILAIPVTWLAIRVVANLSGSTPLSSIWLTLLIVAIASFMPDLWLSHIATDRQKQIRLELPDTLDLLTINVEAGLSFDAAIDRIVQNLPGALSDEFSRMLREMQLGRSRQEALRAMMERTRVAEFNSFILAVIEADIFGISIGQTLRSQSHDMRIRRRQRAEQAAMKTPVKIIFPLVLFIFPAIIIIIAGPAGIRIAEVLGSGGL